MECRGKLNEEWQEYYLPAIQALGTWMEAFGIQTLLACIHE